MGNLLSYCARLGIVRVLSVPIAMVAIMYLLWVLATPPEDLGDDGDSNRP
jgi:hypothetical protein